MATREASQRCTLLSSCSLCGIAVRVGVRTRLQKRRKRNCESKALSERREAQRIAWRGRGAPAPRASPPRTAAPRASRPRRSQAARKRVRRRTQPAWPQTQCRGPASTPRRPLPRQPAARRGDTRQRRADATRRSGQRAQKRKARCAERRDAPLEACRRRAAQACAPARIGALRCACGARAQHWQQRKAMSRERAACARRRGAGGARPRSAGRLCHVSARSRVNLAPFQA